MTTALYDASVPVFIRALTNLSAILEKGKAFAEDSNIAHWELLNARLIEDMAPLTAQVQRASDTAKGLVVRVGQMPNVTMPDEESSFDELQERLTKTIDLLRATPAAMFEGRDHADVILQTPSGDIPFTGESYVYGFAVPNFFFHHTTAYAILRMKGVPVGKLDFLGSMRN